MHEIIPTSVVDRRNRADYSVLTRLWILGVEAERARSGERNDCNAAVTTFGRPSHGGWLPRAGHLPAFVRVKISRREPYVFRTGEISTGTIGSCEGNSSFRVALFPYSTLSLSFSLFFFKETVALFVRTILISFGLKLIGREWRFS